MNPNNADNLVTSAVANTEPYNFGWMAIALTGIKRVVCNPGAGMLGLAREADPLPPADPAVAGGIRRAHRPAALHARQVTQAPQARPGRQQRAVDRESGFVGGFS